MCNEVQRIQHFIKRWSGRSTQDLFSQIYIKPEFQYNHVYPGHCMTCKKPLQIQEMWPPGRCPRSMCEICYHRTIVGVINERCIISGDRLPDYKINDQRLNPREVKNNISDGYARDYYTLLTCKVVGVDVSFIKDEGHDYLPQHFSDIFSYHNPDVIEAEYEVNPVQRLDFSNMALPPPPNLLRVPSTISKHKGKKVRVISKQSKKRW